jgi:hypothetical protein
MMVISLSLLSFTLNLDRGIGELPVVDILDRHRRDDLGHGVGFGKHKPCKKTRTPKSFSTSATWVGRPR